MILSISGRKGSGKDTVGHIIQYLTAYGEYSSLENFMERSPITGGTPWEIKKFAGKLKEIARSKT